MSVYPSISDSLNRDQDFPIPSIVIGIDGDQFEVSFITSLCISVMDMSTGETVTCRGPLALAAFLRQYQPDPTPPYVLAMPIPAREYIRISAASNPRKKTNLILVDHTLIEQVECCRCRETTDRDYSTDYPNLNHTAPLCDTCAPIVARESEPTLLKRTRQQIVAESGIDTGNFRDSWAVLMKRRGIDVGR